MICPRSHHSLVAKQDLELQIPEVKLIQCSGLSNLTIDYLSNLTTMLKMDIVKRVPNVTLKQNIFVFQLKNEELLCMYIGHDVTIVTKINRLLNLQLRYLQSCIINAIYS